MPFASSSELPGRLEGLRLKMCLKVPSSMNLVLRGVRTAEKQNVSIHRLGDHG